ncbi:MAG: GTPase HflX [Oligoflexia bacterium]|nr:GTPase HflX [Oligoflexia bacterium]MBF0365955.1 GTPase HflX [Oligoflexia bacterium]
MFENFSIPVESKATLVSMVCPHFNGHDNDAETAASLRELRELLRTLGVVAQSEHIQQRKKLEASTMIGKGKLEEIAEVARAEDSTFLVFDFELTASQVKNIKKITGFEAIDRCSVILEIFAKHAHTREAKIQIEISRLEYLLPRLTTFWTHFTRIRGGAYHKGGEGEQQLELDRRMVRKRIEHYREQMKEIVVSREQQRKRREKNVVTAAIVGYTNAGKSSLMNRLCKVHVVEEDKLFSTLDVTCRTLNPESRPPMVMIDTVGLLQNLPASLISGFKTTLDSAETADLLVIVCDISDHNHEKHLQVTIDFLKELGIGDKDRIIVFNKKDLLASPDENLNAIIMLRTHPHSFLISCHDPQDVKKLREFIINFFLNQQSHYDLFIPYEQGEAHAMVLSKTNVMSQVHHQNGIFYRIRVPDFIIQHLGVSRYILSQDDPRRSEF